MLDENEVSGTQFDTVVPDIIDDARVGSDRHHDQQGQQNGLERTVQYGNGRGEFVTINAYHHFHRLQELVKRRTVHVGTVNHLANHFNVQR